MTRKKEGGIVFSTNPDFDYNDFTEKEEDTLPINEQELRVWIESTGRKGKTVTIIKGFVGKKKDREALAKELKTRCGTGGSVKEGEIVIQGDVREKVLGCLMDKGYSAKKAGR